MRIQVVLEISHTELEAMVLIFILNCFTYIQ